jgi:hypothetical protein
MWECGLCWTGSEQNLEASSCEQANKQLGGGGGNKRLGIYWPGEQPLANHEGLCSSQLIFYKVKK